MTDVQSGVPQGGVLSGLMFILFMEDMPNNFQYVKTSMYADDAKLYAPIMDEASEEAVQRDLNELSKWCKTWCMRLNVQKCFFLQYVPQNRSRASLPKYSIDGVLLENREKASDLGIIIQNNLKFHDQVAKACKKANTQINIIRRNFKSRNPKFLESKYNMHIRPHIEYSIQVWNPV